MSTGTLAVSALEPHLVFLEKNTLNSNVNNCTVGNKQYQIKFEYTEGIKKHLADTLNRLVKHDPDLYQYPEPEDHEYGDCIFELKLKQLAPFIKVIFHLLPICLHVHHKVA